MRKDFLDSIRNRYVILLVLLTITFYVLLYCVNLIFDKYNTTPDTPAGAITLFFFMYLFLPLMNGAIIGFCEKDPKKINSLGIIWGILSVFPTISFMSFYLFTTPSNESKLSIAVVILVLIVATILCNVSARHIYIFMERRYLKNNE